MTTTSNTFLARLKTHAKQICSAVLGANVADSLSISAHITSESLPTYITASNEYMVEVDFSNIPSLVDSARRSLCSFLGKPVFAPDAGSPVCLYWGEGDPTNTGHIGPVPNADIHVAEITAIPAPLATVSWMKTDTVLPIWLDSLIFDKLGARHQPDWRRFENNLDLGKDEIQVYLGTYFPRSYAEAFCILDALLNKKSFGAMWREKTEVSLLDIGTGTGGNLVGFLTALAKHCPSLKKVRVHGYDGNTLALDAARSIFSSFQAQAPFTVDVSLTDQRIDSLTNFPVPTLVSYDLISTSKMGGEIVSQGTGKSDDYYHHFLMSYAELLSNNGLLVLLDVTTKPAHTAFLPQLLNAQVSRFTRTHRDFATVIPVPCHLYESGCSELCFTQKEFLVTHSAAHNDPSRIAYRVVARKQYATTIHEGTHQISEYVICRNKEKEQHNICKHSSGCGTMQDGFSINSGFESCV